jgi:hypothetical protein
VACCFAILSQKGTEQCYVATASSSCAKAAQTAKVLLVAVLVYSRSICDEFLVSQKTVEALFCLLSCPVIVSSFLAMMAISRWPILASVVDHKDNMFLVSCYDPVEKHPIFVNTIDQVMSVLSARTHATLCWVT